MEICIIKQLVNFFSSTRPAPCLMCSWLTGGGSRVEGGMIVADNWLPPWRSLAVFQFGALRGLNSSDEHSHTLRMCQTEEENHWDGNWQDSKMWARGREREREKGLFMGDEGRKKREAFKCVSPRCLFTALLLETDSFKALWRWEKKIKQQSHKMLHS